MRIFVMITSFLLSVYAHLFIGEVWDPIYTNIYNVYICDVTYPISTYIHNVYISDVA